MRKALQIRLHSAFSGYTEINPIFWLTHSYMKFELLVRHAENSIVKHEEIFSCNMIEMSVAGIFLSPIDVN